MVHNRNPIVIDQATGEVLKNMRAAPAQSLPEIPAAFRKGKTGEQLNILFNAVWFKNVPAMAHLSLGINKFGTNYCYFNGQFYFFDSNEFDDQLTKTAMMDFSMTDLAPKVITQLKTLLRTHPQLWCKDAEVVTNPSIRVIDQGHNYIGYVLQPGNTIPLIQVHPNSFSFSQGVFVPSASKWPQHAQHYDAFSQQTLINTRANPTHHLSNLLHLIKQIGISDKLNLIMLTTLVHTLIGKQHLLIEITGDNEGHCLTVFKTIKTLIDDTIEHCKPLPNRPDEIKRNAFEDYLMSFEQHTDKTLKEGMQTTFIELLNGAAVAEAYPKAKYPTRCHIKRPIMIKAPEPVISLPSLNKRTLSFHLSGDSLFLHSANINLALIDSARIELLRLTQLVSHTIYPSFCQNQPSYSLDISGFDEMHDFIRLGCEISYLIHGTPAKFRDEFIHWSIENAFLQLDNNDSAYLVYLWAKDHAGTSATQPLKDWLNEISYYAESEGVELKLITPRKFGADLKRAHALLKKLGVDCVSQGRSTRMSSWTFNVEQNIEINKSIVVNFNNNPALQGISAAYI